MDHLSETALNTYNNSLVAFARAINTDPTTSHWCVFVCQAAIALCALLAPT